MVPSYNNAPYCLLTSCKEIETVKDQFLRYDQRPHNWKIFLRILSMSLSFLYFIDPQLHAKFQKNNNERSHGKTDHLWKDDAQVWLLRIWSGKPRAQNIIIHLPSINVRSIKFLPWPGFTVTIQILSYILYTFR